MIGFVKDEKAKKGLLYGIAVIIVMGLLYLFLREEPKEKQYDIVFLGDSIVANAQTEVTITTVMEERLGMTVFNGAFGGTGMSVQNERLWSSAANAELSMVKLAKAICNNDWQSQQAAIAYAEKHIGYNTMALDYFVPKMEELVKIDFSKVKILIIEHGTNDYNGGQRLDNPKDKFDETTYAGALRKTLTLLQTTYPKLRIVLVSPIYCNLETDPQKECYNTAYGEGGTLVDYVLLEKEIAEEYGVEWIDAYHGSGIWQDEADYYLYDGLHLVEDGQRLLGNFIADYFEENESIGMD